MFYIRVDANQEVATGHLMRCMAIARAMGRQGQDCTFIMADCQNEGWIRENGFKTICLNSVWNDLDGEIEQLLDVIKAHKIQCILFDTYFVTEQYLRTIRRYVRTIYLDDLYQFPYPVDALINYNNYCDVFPYEECYKGTGTKLWLGCDYVPLREEFADVGYQVKERVGSVLITTGGTDPYNVAGKLVRHFVETGAYREWGTEFHVVMGRYSRHIGDVEKLAERYDRVTLHQNVSRMSELMIGSDMAISAGGSTLYELCACGVPTICFAFADNQLNGVRGFAEKGIMWYAGDLREGEEDCYRRIGRGIDHYMHPLDRVGVSAKMRSLVDGRGAYRLAKEIVQWLKEG